MILKPNHEIIGYLKDVKDENGQIKLIFSVNKEIELPKSAFAVTELKEYIGEKAGISNVDNRIYRIRRISPRYKNKKQAEGDSP